MPSAVAASLNAQDCRYSFALSLMTCSTVIPCPAKNAAAL
jgi:hypothetical protein